MSETHEEKNPIPFPFKRRNMKRRWRDEESRTGGYSRSRCKNYGLKIANDQIDAKKKIEEA